MSDIDEAMQRNDAIRVLQLAIASVEHPADDPAQVLRNIEEGGYTLRLTSREERAAKRRDLEVEIFGSAEPQMTTLRESPLDANRELSHASGRPKLRQGTVTHRIVAAPEHRGRTL